MNKYIITTFTHKTLSSSLFRCYWIWCEHQIPLILAGFLGGLDFFSFCRSFFGCFAYLCVKICFEMTKVTYIFAKQMFSFWPSSYFQFDRRRSPLLAPLLPIFAPFIFCPRKNVFTIFLYSEYLRWCLKYGKRRRKKNSNENSQHNYSINHWCSL